MDLQNLLKRIKLNENNISMALGVLILIVVGAIVVNYFKGQQQSDTLPSGVTTEKTQVTLPTKHTVAKGETLWSIAEKYYKSGYNWVDIQKENNLLLIQKTKHLPEKVWILLQELRADPEQLPAGLRSLSDYRSFFSPAQKEGYAGVAVYSKKEPLRVENEIGLSRFDHEGRILKLFFPDFVLMNVYMPHGGRKKENMDYKLMAYVYLVSCVESVSRGKIILAGDFNVAHKEIDLARPKQNYSNTMFTPEERAKIDELIGVNLEDSFRLFNREPGNYSWFPYSFKAKERNLGWRIDYAFVSKNLTSRVKQSSILKNVAGSDHCPILLELNLD